MKSTRLIVMLSVLLTLSGCLSLGGRKDCDERISDGGEAATKAELAQLLKLHRLCLERYEDNVTKLKENCGVYREAIHDLVPANQRSSVVDILDRLLERKR